MKFRILILFIGLWMISFCKTVEPQKMTVSQTGQGLLDYTLTIRVRDAGGSIMGDILDQVQKMGGGGVNILQTDWSGFYDGFKEIRVRLIAPSEKQVSILCMKMYSIPNIVSVFIDKY